MRCCGQSNKAQKRWQHQNLGGHLAATMWHDPADKTSPVCSQGGGRMGLKQFRTSYLNHTLRSRVRNTALPCGTILRESHREWAQRTQFRQNGFPGMNLYYLALHLGIKHSPLGSQLSMVTSQRQGVLFIQLYKMAALTSPSPNLPWSQATYDFFLP